MEPKKDRPTGIEMVGAESIIVHWEDGHTSTFPSGYLRAKCPCATCTSEKDAPPPKVGIGVSLPLLPKKALPGIHAENIEPVGYYAVKIDWSDGHQAGIYSFAYLRSICPCRECVAG